VREREREFRNKPYKEKKKEKKPTNNNVSIARKN
jgi:hypothetical protein